MGDITIGIEDISSKDAERLLGELSDTLEKITGNSGRGSFNNEDIENKRAVYVVARDSKGDALGCGAIRCISDDAAELKRMYVRKKGLGVGTKILKFLESEAKKLNYNCIMLETRVINKNAVNFYKKNNYIVIDNYGKYLGRKEAICFKKRLYFLETERIGFSKWTDKDTILAQMLWGEHEVTKYICASGVFSKKDILERLALEVENDKNYGVQYWPIFDKNTEEFIGCCGLRPFKNEKDSYEIGFHLRKEYWHKGIAYEAGSAVIDYAFKKLKAEKIYAGHHPENNASEHVLKKLGFNYIGKNYYEPTGLYHPSYERIIK